MKYLLDTHVWIWWNSDPEKLSRKAKSLISDPKRYEELLLSAMSVWEFFKLIELGRLEISVEPMEWVKGALNMAKLRLVPLTPTIAYQSTTLPGEFHGDPADQIITATSREEDTTLISKDTKLINYKYVRTFW